MSYASTKGADTMGHVSWTDHEVAMQKVSVPTVLVKELVAGVRREEPVCIQWFGEGDMRVPSGHQYFFGLMSKPDAEFWQGKHGDFRVAWLGPAKDWPRPELRDEMAETAGGPDGWIALLVNGNLPTMNSAGMGPTCRAVAVILLADPLCGVITPTAYSSPEVLDEETDKINPRIKCPVCNFRSRVDNKEEQIAHMDEHHGEFVMKRIFEQGCDEETAWWFDPD